MKNTDTENELPENNEKAFEDACRFLDAVALEAEKADRQIIGWICNTLQKENERFDSPVIKQVCVALKRFKKEPSITILVESMKYLRSVDGLNYEQG